MIKTVKNIFKSIGHMASILEKESEKLKIESFQSLNECIEKHGGIEEVKKLEREMEDYLLNRRR